MAQIIPSLQNVTQTDTFTSPSLQSVRGAETAYRIYVGSTVISQLRASLLAYDALNTVALAIERVAGCNNSTGGCAANLEDILSLQGADGTSLSAVATGQAALEEVANNIVTTFGTIDEPSSGMTSASDLVRDLVTEIGVVNWQAYKEICRPLYCDVFNTKNATTRVTEFLAVIGGLWQACIFGGIVAWFLIGFVVRFEDHTYAW